MKIIKTANLSPSDLSDPVSKLCAYNGLDCAVTLEVLEALLPQLSPTTRATYEFSKSLQGPILDMNSRGILIDEERRKEVVSEYRETIWKLTDQLNKILRDGIGFEFEVSKNRKWHFPSNDQLAKLFYEVMGLSPSWKINTNGERVWTVDRKALEKLEQNFYAEPIVGHLLVLRDLTKKVSVLETTIDSDGRIRTTFNIAGTNTGRFASSFSDFGTGTNLQNVENKLRSIFIADLGYKFGNIDLEQSDARAVGAIHWNLFRDPRYLNACECLTGDHEILTPNGWQTIDNKPAVIATWKEGIIRFETIDHWNEGTSNKFIAANNRSVSLLGTNNHSMPVCLFNKISRKSLAQLKNMPNFIAPNTGIYTGGSIKIIEAELIAAFQADGTRDMQGKVHWSFIKEPKIKLLRELLIKFNYKYSEYKLGSGMTRFYLKSNQGQDQWKKECNAEILTWDIETLKKFCISHKFWDAHWDASNIYITSASYNHISWLATAYMLTGKFVSLNKHKKTYWKLTIKVNKNYQHRYTKFQEIDTATEIKVFCPTTSSGFFLVRRNNKMFISGNSGDLHTSVAKIGFPELPWTGDLIHDRVVAATKFYRHFDYRDASKRLGHGTNYQGKPEKMSRETHIPITNIKAFQPLYLKQFPAFPLWWDWTERTIRETHKITTLLGRQRYFFGRTWPPDHPETQETVRAAVAYEPQSVTADTINRGLLALWLTNKVQLLLQVHDSILFQYPEEQEDEIIPTMIKLIEQKIILKEGREFIIPAEAKVGWNWADYDKENPDPDSLRKFNDSDRPKIRTRN